MDPEPPDPGIDLRSAVDELSALVDHARPVPLTDQVRVEREELRTALERIRDAVAAELGPVGGTPKLRSALEKLERAGERAKPVPLTSQVRVSAKEIRKQLEKLRRALSDVG